MQKETLRQSPFIFLKNLFIIELLFALVPLILIFLNVDRSYEATRIADIAPFTVLWTILITLLQILAVSAAFLMWYLPRYVVNDGIYFQRGPGRAMKKLVDFADIKELHVEQGPLGRRLGYGDVMVSSNQSQSFTIKGIDDPGAVVDQFEARIQQALVHQDVVAPRKSVPELLAEGESQYTEFKSSLMWDYRQQRINKKLYTPVMKSLAAFMNSRGGHLLIGVDDEGHLLGIEADLQGMRKPNLDGWENTFNLAFNKMIGVEYRRLIDLEFYEQDGRTVCHVYVRPANRPIFLKENNEEKFYVRAGNASQPLTFSQAVRYIQARFPDL